MSNWIRSVMASLLLVPACGGSAQAGLDAVRETGLRVGFATEPPYAYVGEDGSPTGEAVMTFQHAAAGLGIRSVKWVPLEFGELLPSLEAGRIDVIASGMFITPDRAARVRFTTPTVCVGTALVMRADAVPGISRPADAASCDTCRFAVLRGSVESDVADSLGIGDRTMHLPDLGTAAAALELGRVDVLLISSPTARRLVADDASLLLVAPSARTADGPAAPGTGCAAFALRREQAELADSIDARLSEFIGTPEHLELLRSFGFGADEAGQHR